MPCQDPLPSPRQPELTVLVDEHADGDAAEVEAVQEVLDVLVGDRVIAVGVLVLQHSLCHGGHYIIVPVPDGDQGFGEPSEKAGICPYRVSGLGTPLALLYSQLPLTSLIFSIVPSLEEAPMGAQCSAALNPPLFSQLPTHLPTYS